jgi:hypothetical protein
MRIQLRDRIEPEILCRFKVKPSKCCVDCIYKTSCCSDCNTCKTYKLDYNGFGCATYEIKTENR